MGSLVRLQQDVIATIMNNTERMINDSDDQMEEELKMYHFIPSKICETAREHNLRHRSAGHPGPRHYSLCVN
jgi:hypothetical protein